jgi:putative resolvase
MDYARGYGEIEVLSDIGSGLNEGRRNFLKLLVSEGRVSKVIVAYDDRLTRFGFEALSRLFSSFEATIEVINHEEKTPKEELVEDLITIVSRFAGKLYGMRSHKYREVVEGVRKLVKAYSIQHNLDIKYFINDYMVLLNDILEDLWGQ